MQVNDYNQARAEWKRYRSTVGAKSVVAALEKMAGTRKRCVYCCDSRCSDIDHFKPVKLDFNAAFKWNNFILICPECNRHKGAKFAYAEDGSPLLIDPTTADPWQHLILDAETGIIAPRFSGESYDLKGEYTLSVISPVNDEATAEGRRRAAEKYIELAGLSALEGDSANARKAFTKAVKYDEFGLAPWFAFCEGKRNHAFLSLQEKCPALWQKFCILACKQALNAL
ncbi:MULTISPECIES: HNH endonuclease [unclassified Streptomyces]|uniref:HNH endonuclease n=1 Tax=unclassified Streptomyces TaxID=2593676 RepID=UPI0013715591|nr:MULTISPECIES: HNH endonuclease [unclassified Streptomyces]